MLYILKNKDAEENKYNQCISVEEDIFSHNLTCPNNEGSYRRQLVTESLFMCFSINNTTCHFVFFWNRYEVNTHTHTHAHTF